MKKAGIIGIAAVVLLVAAGAYAMSDFFVTKSWNYRISIEVETPEGIKTGSTVRQVNARKELAGYINPGAGIIKFDVIGEAAIVDLGERGILMELPSYNVLLEAFPYRDNENKVDYYSSLLSVGKIGNVDITNYAFVTFIDIANPESIQTVRKDDFENIFGAGVKLKKISVQITDEPILWGQVRKYLGWFDSKKIGLVQWNPNLKDSAKYLTKSSFIKGEE